MMFLSRAESSYLHQHLSVVRHVTLDPEGPGVLRIHLLPCKKARRNVPFVALLNGQDILPLSVSWAILLAGLMDALQPFEAVSYTHLSGAPSTLPPAPYSRRPRRRGYRCWWASRA